MPPQLIDGQKYFCAPTAEELAMSTVRYDDNGQLRRRGMTFRSLFRLAVRCQDADELGKLLRQVGRPGRSTAERPTRPNSKGCSAPSEARRPSQ